MRERVTNAIAALPKTFNSLKVLTGVMVVLFIAMQIGIVVGPNDPNDTVTGNGRHRNLLFLRVIFENDHGSSPFSETDIESLYDWLVVHRIIPDDLSYYKEIDLIDTNKSSVNVEGFKKQIIDRIGTSIQLDATLEVFAPFFYDNLERVVENAIAMGEVFNNDALRNHSFGSAATFFSNLRLEMDRRDVTVWTTHDLGSGRIGPEPGASSGASGSGLRGTGRRGNGRRGNGRRGPGNTSSRSTSGVDNESVNESAHSSEMGAGNKRDRCDNGPTGFSPPQNVRRSGREHASTRAAAAASVGALNSYAENFTKEPGTSLSSKQPEISGDKASGAAASSIIDDAADSGETEDDELENETSKSASLGPNLIGAANGSSDVSDAHFGGGASGSARANISLPDDGIILHSDLMQLTPELRLTNESLAGKHVLTMHGEEDAIVLGTIYRINGQNALPLNPEFRSAYGGMRGTLAPNPACRFNAQNDRITHDRETDCSYCGIQGGCIICSKKANSKRRDIFVAVCDWCHEAIQKIFLDVDDYPKCATIGCHGMLGFNCGVRILSGNSKSVDRTDRELYCYKCRPYTQRQDVWHRFEDLGENFQERRLTRLWNAIHPGEEDAVLNFTRPPTNRAPFDPSRPLVLMGGDQPVITDAYSTDADGSSIASSNVTRVANNSAISENVSSSGTRTITALEVSNPSLNQTTISSSDTNPNSTLPVGSGNSGSSHHGNSSSNRSSVSNNALKNHTVSHQPPASAAAPQAAVVNTHSTPGAPASPAAASNVGGESMISSPAPAAAASDGRGALMAISPPTAPAAPAIVMAGRGTGPSIPDSSHIPTVMAAAATASSPAGSGQMMAISPPAGHGVSESADLGNGVETERLDMPARYVFSRQSDGCGRETGRNVGGVDRRVSHEVGGSQDGGLQAHSLSASGASIHGGDNSYEIHNQLGLPEYSHGHQYNTDYSGIGMATKRLEECEVLAGAKTKRSLDLIHELTPSIDVRTQSIEANNKMIEKNEASIQHLREKLEAAKRSHQALSAGHPAGTLLRDEGGGNTTQDSQTLEEDAQTCESEVLRSEIEAFQSSIRELELENADYEISNEEDQYNIKLIKTKISRERSAIEMAKNDVESARKNLDLEISKAKSERVKALIAERKTMKETEAAKAREASESAAREIEAGKLCAEIENLESEVNAFAQEIAEHNRRVQANTISNLPVIGDFDRHSAAILLDLRRVHNRVSDGFRQTVDSEMRRMFENEPDVYPSMDPVEVRRRYRRYIAAGNTNLVDFMRDLHNATGAFLSNHGAMLSLGQDTALINGPVIAVPAAAVPAAAVPAAAVGDGAPANEGNDNGLFRARDLLKMRVSLSESVQPGNATGVGDISDDECLAESAVEFQRELESVGGTAVEQEGFDHSSATYDQDMRDTFRRRFMHNCDRMVRRARLGGSGARVGPEELSRSSDESAIAPVSSSDNTVDTGSMNRSSPDNSADIGHESSESGSPLNSGTRAAGADGDQASGSGTSNENRPVTGLANTGARPSPTRQRRSNSPESRQSDRGGADCRRDGSRD
jgi:hypothetical protein